MIEIKEDVKVGDIVLEAGDKIKVLKEGVYQDILINVQILNTVGRTSLIALRTDESDYWGVITDTELNTIQNSYGAASAIFAQMNGR